MTEPQGFREWAASSGLLQKADIAELQNTTIAIDAEDYIHTLLTEHPTREPLLPAIGGQPFALIQHIDRFVGELEQASIKAIFVFNGLELGCRDRRSIARESKRAATIIDNAWKIYDGGHGDDAVQQFGRTCTYRTAHIIRSVFFHLHTKGQDVFVAPYNAAAQMIIFLQHQYVHAVHGSANALVFGAEQVITSIDWHGKRFNFLDREQVLGKIGLNQSQLVDLLLLSGSSILSAMPSIDQEATVLKIDATKTHLTRYGNDGHMACAQFKDDEYLDLFRRAKIAVRHMVVMLPDGDIVQLDKDNAPSNLHECIGQVLPPELIAYHKNGLIGSRVLNWRTRREIFETPPLDGGDSPTYREVIREKLVRIRSKSIALLTQSLHRYYLKQDVDLVAWFSEIDRRPLGIPDVPRSDRDIDSWHVKEAFIKTSTEAIHLDANKTPIQYAIALLANDSFATKTYTTRDKPSNDRLKTPLELLCNSMWRFLQERGYINSNHTLSARGRMLKAAFDYASQKGRLGSGEAPNEFEEAIFLAFELLSLDLLSTKLLFQRPPYSGEPTRGTEKEKANIRLITRVACLGSFRHQAIGYTGPLSRHLLAYHQVASAVRSSLRDLAEVHSVHMLLSGSAQRMRPGAELTDLGARLPFIREPDSGLAIVLKSYLDEFSNPNGRADIKKWFGFAVDVEGDLKKAMDLWGAVNTGVQVADTAVVSPDLRDVFANADQWLKDKTSGINGTA